MLKKISVLLSVASLCVLTACSEDDKEPTLAEKCAKDNGINEGCLTGKWLMNGLYEKSSDNVFLPGYDYSAQPGLLEIFTDEKACNLMLSYPYAIKSEMHVNNNWNEDRGYVIINDDGAGNKSITFDFAFGDMCQPKTKQTVVPQVDLYSMDLNDVIFQTQDGFVPGSAKESLTRIN